MTSTTRYSSGSRVLGLASRLKVTGTIFLIGSSLILTGCSGAAGIAADDFASQVAATVEKNINVGAEVDCGTDAIALEVGTTTECFITDPESSDTFRADVEITSVGDDKQLELKLSVDSEAM